MVIVVISLLYSIFATSFSNLSFVSLLDSCQDVEFLQHAACSLSSIDLGG